MDKNGRPDHINDALCQLHAHCWYKYTDNKNQIYANLRLTDKMGVGYQVNDKLMVGAVKNGENYDLFGRYNVGTVYLSLQAPTDSTMTDNMNIGVGYSLCIYKNLYIEPNYTIPMNENSEGNREGSFKLGVAYRF